MSGKITVELVPVKVWIESDMFGGRHVMRQYESDKPFCYCSFFYDYAHTSNAQTLMDAEDMARRLGAAEPIEHKTRMF